ALHDFKLNVIAFLQALVALRLDGAVMDKHVRAVFPADKAEALRVVEPFHFTFDSRHVPYSEPSVGDAVPIAPWTVFSVGLFNLPQGMRNTVTCKPGCRVVLPQLWLCRYFLSVLAECQTNNAKRSIIANFFRRLA